MAETIICDEKVNERYKELVKEKSSSYKFQVSVGSICTLHRFLISSEKKSKKRVNFELLTYNIIDYLIDFALLDLIYVSLRVFNLHKSDRMKENYFKFV